MARFSGGSADLGEDLQLRQIRLSASSNPTGAHRHERTRLAAEYAERYALDHHGLDDGFWTRMTAHYDQREIVELSMSIGARPTFGRLDHVLGLDAVCVLPGH